MIETPSGRLLRGLLPPVLVMLGVAILTVIAVQLGGDDLSLTITETLIRLTVVVGLSIFVGNSGIVSFGHIGFMCIGAYVAAWATCNPMWKQLMLTGLPTMLQENQYPFLVAVAGGGILAAFVGLILGAAILRLSGIAASIATFAFLAIVNNVYSNWDTVTAATSSIIGIPVEVDPYMALAFALCAIAIAFWFKDTRMGLMLRASRDDGVAARASGVSILKVRLVAFVLSAFVVGVGGTLWAQFLGVLTVDMFYLPMTFMTLAMLIVGGMGSVTGAVVGTIAVTVFVQLFRAMEGGVTVGATTFALPQGTQEIALGIAMALILIFLPAGLTRSRELRLRRQRAATGDTGLGAPASLGS
ncbi:amino acid/amide ABC transporter membrane protein 2, HAAT family [Arboricoccus pini]|uniref:Amino acid/amide ABC transporter membrane protein 2, HAAT family n=1 Tax=Arboricoccus pini TaxID=1963835 RepID=A0A212RI07_9PROT|nr:branched-chain amino acid ABC transporter permease [Arboricoccus pini]SNB71990.1 amino acid/amide ABC transporter membrane protein 2, HAAT family [Arboricoccus pini]